MFGISIIVWLAILVALGLYASYVLAVLEDDGQ